MADLTRVVRRRRSKTRDRKMVLVSLRPEIASSTPPSGGKGVEPFHFWIVTPPELRVSDDHVATR